MIKSMTGFGAGDFVGGAGGGGLAAAREGYFRFRTAAPGTDADGIRGKPAQQPVYVRL